jgi:hypothetical protein
MVNIKTFQFTLTVLDSAASKLHLKIETDKGIVIDRASIAANTHIRSHYRMLCDLGEQALKRIDGLK